MIRLGFLDLVHGYNDITKLLKRHNDTLGYDLRALKQVCKGWNTNKPLDVGDSGTLYRILKFYLWKNGERRVIIARKSLKDRQICEDPDIINLPLADLLAIDHHTSQWASAAVLNGNRERIDNPPYKLRLTYEAISHWETRRNRNMCWTARLDETIMRQASAFRQFVETGKMRFVPSHSEDYCFARVFDLMTTEEGKERWMSLVGHESNRITETEIALEQARKGVPVDSRDHRVVQAIAMWACANRRKVKIMYKGCVKKSWTRFWLYLERCDKIWRRDGRDRTPAYNGVQAG